MRARCGRAGGERVMRVARRMSAHANPPDRPRATLASRSTAARSRPRSPDLYPTRCGWVGDFGRHALQRLTLCACAAKRPTGLWGARGGALDQSTSLGTLHKSERARDHAHLLCGIPSSALPTGRGNRRGDPPLKLPRTIGTTVPENTQACQRAQRANTWVRARADDCATAMTLSPTATPALP